MASVFAAIKTLIKITSVVMSKSGFNFIKIVK